MLKRFTPLLLAGWLVSLIGMPALAVTPVDQQRLHATVEDGREWLSYGRDQAETRYSPLDQINTDTVSDLGLAWSLDLPDNRGLQATPLVADGVLYFSGNWNRVYAVDARSGNRLWSYDAQVDRKRAGLFCCGVVNRGLAMWGELLIMGTLDGYLVAIDRASGAEVWRTLTIDQSQPYAITGAPRVLNGAVIIGNGGSEYGARGYVGAYSADTGELLWRFYTVPGNPADGFENELMARAAETWSGEWWTMGGGGTVWDALAYDPELDLLFVGVGNGGPHNQLMRSPGGGDNLYLASIVALRPQTGEYVWHHQQNPGETWDYTATQHMVLAEISWQGELRKVIMQAPKNGFFFILDRATGELLSAEPYVPVNWATGYDLDTGRPIEVPGARYEKEPWMLKPSGLGGHNWHPMSYSKQTELMYIPALDFAAPMENADEYIWYHNQWNLGYETSASPLSNLINQAIIKRMASSYLLAWDPATQSEAWRVPIPLMGHGGVLSTAGGLVFQGNAGNRLVAYDAESGGELWGFDSQHGIIAAPITYSLDGQQYVSVLAGRGGGFSMMMGLEYPPATTQRRLLTFKLGASGQLPGFELPAQRTQPPPDNEVSAASIERGSGLYMIYCARCHGTGVVSDGSVPDLRRLSNIWYEQFEAVVLEGSMSDFGMPSYAGDLTAEQVADIKGYVLDRAHEDWEVQQTSDWWLAVQRWWAEIVAWVLVALL